MSKRTENKTRQQSSAPCAAAGAARTREEQAASPVIVTLAQSVTGRLRTAIVEGRFLPDEKLQEISLSAMLNVSRTPIRSALHSLAAEGLLEYVPNRGYRVISLDADRLISIFDLRGVLEGLAARLAAERGMDEATQAEYQSALALGDRIIRNGKLVLADRDRFSEVNVRIHGAIQHAADNRMLNDMIRLCQNIRIASDRYILWNDYAWIRRSHDDHHRLFDAIRLRDGARAEQLMWEHVRTVKLQMKKLLEQAAALSH